MTNETINYQDYTRLPVKHLIKINMAGATLEVTTPHKGRVLIELQKVDRGMFSAPTELPRESAEVYYELSCIEHEAKDYLLGKWLKALK